MPIVVVDNYMAHREFDCITINNEQGVHEVVEYFADMGHRDIGYLHVDHNANNFSERYYGFLRAMETFGLEMKKENLIQICTSGGDAVYQELKKKDGYKRQVEKRGSSRRDHRGGEDTVPGAV